MKIENLEGKNSELREQLRQARKDEEKALVIIERLKNKCSNLELVKQEVSQASLSPAQVNHGEQSSAVSQKKVITYRTPGFWNEHNGHNYKLCSQLLQVQQL